MEDSKADRDLEHDPTTPADDDATAGRSQREEKDDATGGRTFQEKGSSEDPTAGRSAREGKEEDA